MMKCKGCGIDMQYEDPKGIGYTPKKKAEYCQRCFRIRNYNDVTISMKESIASEEVLAKLQHLNALIVWVVDLFDFEADIVAGLNRHLIGKDILLVASKRDLLPKTIGNEKLSGFIQARMKEYGIQIKGIVIIGDLADHARDDDNGSADAVWNAVNTLRANRDVAVIGMANAGKSTMLNAMLGNRDLTASRYPGTTLDINAIDMGAYTLYDTPGLTRGDSLLTRIDDALLKTIVPSKEIKQRIYQLHGDQTLSVGGLLRLDLFACDAACVGYFSDRLSIHRSKQERADDLWSRHLGELLSPAISHELAEMDVYDLASFHEKTDIVIHGLGWFCVSGQLDRLRVYVPKGVNITFRKAMI